MSCRTPRRRSGSRGEGGTPALFNETVTLHFKHQLLHQKSLALDLRKSAQVSLVASALTTGSAERRAAGASGTTGRRRRW